MTLLYSSDIIRLCVDLFKRHNIDCQLKYKMLMSNAMAYNVNENLITFNTSEINPYIRFFPQIKPIELALIMLCHELGHYMDYKINPEKIDLRKRINDNKENAKQFILESERNAWEYGKRFVPEHLMGEFDKLNQMNMDKWLSKMSKTDRVFGKKKEEVKEMTLEELVKRDIEKPVCNWTEGDKRDWRDMGWRVLGKCNCDECKSKEKQ